MPGKATRSSRCASNACVEATLVEGGDGVVVVRDTKEGGRSFAVPLGDWAAFIAELKGNRRAA